MDQPYPILEYDPDPEAVIEPRRLIQPSPPARPAWPGRADGDLRLDVPEHCVLCFFREVITELAQREGVRQIAASRSEMGEHPLYELVLDGRPPAPLPPNFGGVGGRGAGQGRLAFFHPGVGAPLAAGLLEEMIARGCRYFIACGGAGVLDREIAVGHIVVPATAVRDEGTSYHYLPPGREVAASPAGVAAIEEVLRARGVPYVVGKTWTTDAFYRETRAKVRRRKAEGCLTVEMEAAAFFAVAQFRHVTFAQILYGGDDVSSDTWDARDWNSSARSVREKLFWLAAEACLKLSG